MGEDRVSHHFPYRLAHHDSSNLKILFKDRPFDMILSYLFQFCALDWKCFE